jgi:hypothetical protein
MFPLSDSLHTLWAPVPSLLSTRCHSATPFSCTAGAGAGAGASAPTAPIQLRCCCCCIICCSNCPWSFMQSCLSTLMPSALFDPPCCALLRFFARRLAIRSAVFSSACFWAASRSYCFLALWRSYRPSREHRIQNESVHTQRK